MHPELELVLYLFLIITAAVSIYVRDLLTAVVTLTVFSFVMALLYTAMGAVDVGFMEAVVGAGITGVLFVATIYKTTRRSLD